MVEARGLPKRQPRRETPLRPAAPHVVADSPFKTGQSKRRRAPTRGLEALAVGIPIGAAFIGILAAQASVDEPIPASGEEVSGHDPARADTRGELSGGASWGSGSADPLMTAGAAGADGSQAGGELGSLPDGDAVASGGASAWAPSGETLTSLQGAPFPGAEMNVQGGSAAITFAALPTGSSSALSGNSGEGTGDGLGGKIGITVYGTAGNDEIFGTAGDDFLYGGAGDDIIWGLGGDDLLDGGSGNDRLHGGPGDDTLLGGTGHDQLFGDEGNDRLLGGSGHDRLFGGPGRDDLLGGTGDDFLDGQEGSDTLDGGLGDDILVIDRPSDLALEGGGAGTDTLVVQAVFADHLEAERGTDEAVFRQSRDIDAPLPDGAGGFVQQVDPDIENIILDGTTNHDVIGSADGNRITGNDGDNTLYGRGGDDVLAGGAGDDLLDGGFGVDELQGGDGADHLLGGIGNDRLEGGRGDDLLAGGTGADLLYGQGGNDTFALGLNDSDVDTIFDHEGSNELLVEGVPGYQVETAIAGSDLYVVADKNVIAKVDDFASGEDHIAGIDTGSGLQSIESLMAENADQGPALGGTPAGSTVSGSSGSDDILSDFLSAPSRFGGAGSEAISGTSGADWLSGFEGDDVLAGGRGRDVLEGGAGSDRLEGGADDDVYLFRSGETGVDTIHDLQGVNMARLEGYEEAALQAVRAGPDLLVVANGAHILTVEGFAGHESAFAGIEHNGQFTATDDLFV